MILKKYLKRAVYTLLILAFLTIAGYFTLEYLVRDVLMAIAETRAKELGIRLMNQSVAEILSQHTEYHDLIVFSYDDKGKINMIKTDTARLNMFAAQLTLLVHDKLRIETDDAMIIPFSALLELDILDADWPSFAVELTQDSNLYTNYVTTYESVGINQSLFSVYLNMGITMNLVGNLTKTNIEIKNQVLLCQVLIIGDVPNFYWTPSLMGEPFNFVP